MSYFFCRSFGCAKHCKKILRIQTQNICLSSRFNQIPPQLPRSKSSLNKSPITWKTLGITTLLGGSFLAYMYYLQAEKDRRIEKERKRQIGKADIGGPFELVNSEGKLVKSEDFHGKWALIYFGYLHCPDVCPDELEKLALVVDKLEKEHSFKIQPIFISVDPARDTPATIGQYVKEFSNKIIGLGGTEEQIAKVCKSYRIYRSSAVPDEDNDYLVDHSLMIYLIDPEGNFVDYYIQSHNDESMVVSILINKSKYEDQKKSSVFPQLNLKTQLV